MINFVFYLVYLYNSLEIDLNAERTWGYDSVGLEGSSKIIITNLESGETQEGIFWAEVGNRFIEKHDFRSEK